MARCAIEGQQIPELLYRPLSPVYFLRDPMLTLEGVSSIFACRRPSRAFGAWSRLGQSDVGEKTLEMMMERCKEYMYYRPK